MSFLNKGTVSLLLLKDVSSCGQVIFISLDLFEFKAPGCLLKQQDRPREERKRLFVCIFHFYFLNETKER